MAFGKNKSGPAFETRMTLQQQMKRSSTRPSRTGGGGFYFRDRFQPVTRGRADVIRLLRGDYEVPLVDQAAKDYVVDDQGNVVTASFPFFKYVSYFHGPKQRGCNGSEGPLGEFKGKGDPCIAADWFWYEWRTRLRKHSKRPNSMSRSERWAFSVLVQAPFYKVPQIDKDGKTKTNPNTGEAYYEWVRGSTKRNDEYAAGGYECKEGHVMHWSLSHPQWRVIQEYQNELARHCSSCGGQDSIEELALVCRHCGTEVVVFSETSLNEEELVTLREDEVRCSACGNSGYLEPITRCTECDHGEPATIFDVDLKVKRVETADTGKGKQTVLQIVGFIGPRPIPDVYGEDLRKSLPLEKIFAPTPLDQQEDLFGIPPNDEEDEPRRPASKKRKATVQDDDEDEPEDDEDKDDDADDDEDERPARKSKKKSDVKRQPVNRSREYSR